MGELFQRTPAYACVSAAWLLPLGIPHEGNDGIATLQSRRHHAVHNPHLFINPFSAMQPAVAEKIRERRRLIEQIADSLLTRRRDVEVRGSCAAWFQQLHAMNTALHQSAPRILASIDYDLALAQRARDQNKVLLNREYFFGLHTMESLQNLIATVQTHPNVKSKI